MVFRGFWARFQEMRKKWEAGGEALDPVIQEVGRRFLAKGLDMGFMVFFSGALVYPFGVLVAILYLLLSDGLNGTWREWHFTSQSLGKHLLGLCVVRVSSEQGATWRDSLWRNGFLSLPCFFLFIPVWGWFLALLAGIPLWLIEAYWLATGEKQRRFGDWMAGTQVRECRNAS